MGEWIKKKGSVIQAKPLEKWVSPEKKEYFVYGIGVKWGTKPEETDVGKYYSPTKKQEFFKEGEEVEYLFKLNEKEARDSRIKPFTEEKKSSNTGALNIQDYVARKKVDAVSFSASYAKDIIVASIGTELKFKFEKVATDILKWQLEKLEEL